MPDYDITLSAEAWAERRERHRKRVWPYVEARRQRAGRGEKHPVFDFLFEYYAFRPAYLYRWSPGVGVLLAGLDQVALSRWDWPEDYKPTPDGCYIPPSRFPVHRLEFLDWAINYLQQTGSREPQFGCFGWHEWAMVYQDQNTRHRVPLRLGPAETDAVTESATLRCTHYDAFRFFTPAAVPRNRFQLARETSPQHDQPGCVHVTMDLYKFGFVLAPFTSSELIADAFELAISARVLDMRASPYDLTTYGFEPIQVETREGREQYAHGQQQLFLQSQPIRSRLLAEYQRLQNLLTTHDQASFD